MHKYPGYFLLALLFSSCRQQNDAVREVMPALYEEPAVYKLDTIKGYVINPLTSDSVKPLINSMGDTIVTGIPFSVTAQSIEPPGFKNPKYIKDKPGISSVVEADIHPVLGKPQTIQAKPIPLKAAKLSAEKDSIIVNTSSFILLQRKLLQVSASNVPLHEPMPVKIEPMRYKDNATLDIQYLDVGQGLSNSYVTNLYQDNNGYLWIATDHGLNKYDGTYLTTYTEKDGLNDNRVTSVTGDKEGRIWIGTYKGLCVFDGKNFTRFTDKDGLLTGVVSGLRRDSLDNLWVSLDGLGLVCYKEDKFIYYNSNNNFLENSNVELFPDVKGNVWLSAQPGVIKYDGNNYVYYNPGSLILDRLSCILEDKRNNYWFSSTLYGITKFDGNFFTHYEKKNGLSDNTLMTMMLDSRGNIWIGCRYEGLDKFDGRNFTNYNKALGLSENKILCIREDIQGNIWVGTAGGGINKINDNGFIEKIPLNKFNNSRVRPIVKDKSGHLWFGTEGDGLYSFDGKNLLKHIERNTSIVQGFRSALVDKESNLWFGLHDGSGLYKYDYKQLHYYYPEKPVSSFYSLFQDKNQLIWIGTSREGAASFDGTKLNYYNEAGGFSSNKVFVTIQDKKNNLWFGTDEGGLVKYDARLNDSVGQGKMFTVFCEKQGLFAKSITSIVEDEKGNLWLGTLDAGLCKFDGNNFTYYGEKQGLAFKSVWSLKEDSSRQIWVGTDNGLSVLIPQSETKFAVYSYGLQDGLKSTDFNLNGVCIDNNNRIWWGTGKALITRDLNTDFKTYKPSSLTIKSIEINDEYFDFRNTSTSLTNTIRFDSTVAYQNLPANLSLPYNLNHLNFHFSAIEWQSPHKIKYSYRLLGSDSKWSNLSSQTSADFRNLSHGEYELQVKAIGESNEWTDAFVFKFSIRAAWWQTWWFKIIESVFIVLSVFLIVRFIYLYRLRKQKAALEKQLAVQLERQRISAEMHDDIGAGLSGVKLLTELTKNKIKEEEAAGDMEKIYQSVGDISSRMKEVIWSLSADNDYLDNLIHFLVKQVKAQLEHYSAELKINIPSSIPAMPVSGEARRNIYLAVKEAVNNIIKHSAADKVELRIAYEDELKIIITDNGKGVSNDMVTDTGNGLKNMRQRMKTLGGTMETEKNNGFTIQFQIPLRKEI